MFIFTNYGHLKLLVWAGRQSGRVYPRIWSIWLSSALSPGRPGGRGPGLERYRLQAQGREGVRKPGEDALGQPEITTSGNAAEPGIRWKHVRQPRIIASRNVSKACRSRKATRERSETGHPEGTEQGNASMTEGSAARLAGAGERAEDNHSALFDRSHRRLCHPGPRSPVRMVGSAGCRSPRGRRSGSPRVSHILPDNPGEQLCGPGGGGRCGAEGDRDRPLRRRPPSHVPGDDPDISRNTARSRVLLGVLRVSPRACANHSPDPERGGGFSEELPGYAEYRQKTRYRLVPGVW